MSYRPCHGQDVAVGGRAEHRAGARLAFDSLHPLTPPNRPHNSLYVVNDKGRLVTRYDKR